MKKLFTSLILLLCISVNLYAKDPLVISIGCNCQPAMKLNKFNLRDKAYPFDWVFTDNLDVVVKCIDDKFKHWLDPTHLEYHGWYIYNNFYSVGFSHDFPNVLDDPDFILEVMPSNFFRRNFLDYVPEISLKYDRRIKRFLDVLESNGPVIFIYTQQATPESADNFINFINDRYPQLDYKLLIVNAGPPWYDRIQDYKNEKIIKFYAYEKDEKTPWWKDSEWQNIFYHLGLISNQP